MMITIQNLINMGCSTKNANIFCDHLNNAMTSGNIDTPLRQAHFLAQVLHESGMLRYVKELADGKAYEGRRDLGNVNPGDGVTFRGRGLIQLTGRTNYSALSKAFGMDFVGNPVLLESPEWACKSAVWFWNLRVLNIPADADDVMRITRRINGGLNHIAERKALLVKAKKELGI